MWSKGSSNNAVETEASPSMSATSSSGKSALIALAMKADVCGVSSEGLMMAVLPAARAYTKGEKVRLNG